tara:strand:+ start:3216 stop:5693 length:2478 start_codon:yes stop_codon:yes gene_type:complete
MVFICDEKYVSTDYDYIFDNYSFELSDFQKYAIESIILGNHILITAHTGSGKTLPAEFAIEHFINKNKKVIYTSPIKALSNQKFYEFSKKYPDISIGIMTGDIKFNPEADLLIMTTEILQNNLYKRLQKDIENKSPLEFNLDIERELACVIFDEVHYINDKDRGKVWEETIMMLPRKVQMVMLSATIDNPERFASWCEGRYNDDLKKVWLAPSERRVVPLIHYTYLNTVSSLFKQMKDETLEKEIKKIVGTPMIIKDDSGFKEEVLPKVKKVKSLMKKYNVYVKPGFILNELIKHLYVNEMLPCLCFVFSRKNVERYANEITVNLFDYDSAHVPSIINDECYKIVKKLPNYKDIIRLPEYIQLVSLLEKGVAIHHSGIMPIMREMVEILYGKGYIKVLFATETFAVGINMPTKTVIFSNLSKYSDNGMRNLFSHEYTQMAGRAGRRGLDKIGHVIHCNNLFGDISDSNYKDILSGKPQSLESKFEISYSLILNLIGTGGKIDMFVDASMLGHAKEREIIEYEKWIEKIDLEIECEIKKINDMLVNDTALNEYINLSELEYLSSKRKKEVQHKMMLIEKNYNNNFTRDLKMLKDLRNLRNDNESNKRHLNFLKDYTEINIKVSMELLINNGYVILDKDKNIYKLTDLGVIASKINECNSLVLSSMIYYGELNNLDENELVSFFSCFTNINVSEDYKLSYPDESELLINVKNCILNYKTILNKYDDLERSLRIAHSDRDDIQYDIMRDTYDWCVCDNEYRCKKILQKLNEKEIFLGEFVKALLNIINIVNECIFVAEYLNNIPLLEKLNKIPERILKFIVSNQSLYI